MKMTLEQLAELLEIPSYKVEDMYWDMVDREKLLKLINDCLVKNLTIPFLIERFDIKIPTLNGKLKNIEFKTTGNDKIKHHWMVMHGVKTFAGKEPFQVHLGRTVL